MTKAKKVRSVPVAMKCLTFEEIVAEAQAMPPAPPRTPEQEAELQDLLRQLPGLICVSIPRKSS